MSETSIGKKRGFQVLYAKARQKLVLCGVMEKASGLKPGLEHRVCKTPWCRWGCESELKMEIPFDMGGNAVPDRPALSPPLR